jgi:hypothetical protein
MVEMQRSLANGQLHHVLFSVVDVSAIQLASPCFVQILVQSGLQVFDSESELDSLEESLTVRVPERRSVVFSFLHVTLAEENGGEVGAVVFVQFQVRRDQREDQVGLEQVAGVAEGLDWVQEVGSHQRIDIFAASNIFVVLTPLFLDDRQIEVF